MKLSAAGPQISFQPLEIRFESARRQYNSLCANRFLTTADQRRASPKFAIDHVERGGFGLIHDVHAQPFGGPVVAVHQRLAATEKKGIRAAKMQGASKGRLQSPAKSSNPRRAIRRFSDDEPRKVLVALFARDAKQVCEVLVLGVHIREYVGRRVVAAAEVACMAAVASPEGLGGALDHENARPSLDGSQGCAQSGIAAAEDRDVALLGFTLHRGVPGSGRRIVPCRLLPTPAIEKDELFVFLSRLLFGLILSTRPGDGRIYAKTASPADGSPCGARIAKRVDGLESSVPLTAITHESRPYVS